MRWKARWFVSVICLIVSVGTARLATAAVVSDWNQQGITSAGPQIQRTPAMVHLAMFDAPNAIDKHSTQAFRVPVEGTAASAAWKSIGPVPPAVEAPIAVDPASGTIYIGTFGAGVLKSTDGGATFAWANNGLGGLAISSMAMDPTNPDKLVVGTQATGLYRTEDGGNNWTVTSEASGGVIFVAVNPIDSNIWYAGYFNGPTLKRSIDGGKTWVNSNSGIPNTSVWSIVSDPNNSGVVYAATAGEGAFKSTDGGASWKSMTIRPVVWSLALDPSDTRTIYAGVNGDGVFKSTDAGETFSRVGSPTIGVVLSLVVDPTNRDRIYAATASGGVESSEDGGVTWRRTTISKGVAIALSVTADGDVFAGTAFDGAFVSKAMSRRDLGTGTLQPGTASDAGDRAPTTGDPVERHAAPASSLAPPEREPTNDSDRRHRRPRFATMASAELHSVFAQNIVNIVIDPFDSKHLLLGTNDGGLLGSSDGGDAWIDSGKGFRCRASRRPAFDPTVKGRVYAGSFIGGGLFRSDDNGATWTSHAVGSAAAYVWSSAVDPFSGTVYAGTQNNEGLWRSTDAAETFARIDGTQIPQVRDIVFDRSTRDKLFVAAINGLFRSLDGGKTFSKIASGAINTISIDPTNENIIYAGTQAAGVLKSVDGGAKFVASNTGLVTTFNTSRGNGVAIDPTNPSTLYVATEGAGVFKSVNAGTTWFPINDGLTNLRVFGLALDRDHPNILYVGGSSGVFRTTSGGQ